MFHKPKRSIKPGAGRSVTRVEKRSGAGCFGLGSAALTLGHPEPAQRGRRDVQQWLPGPDPALRARRRLAAAPDPVITMLFTSPITTPKLLRLRILPSRREPGARTELFRGKEEDSSPYHLPAGLFLFTDFLGYREEQTPELDSLKKAPT